MDTIGMDYEYEHLPLSPLHTLAVSCFRLLQLGQTYCLVIQQNFPRPLLITGIMHHERRKCLTPRRRYVTNQARLSMVKPKMTTTEEASTIKLQILQIHSINHKKIKHMSHNV
ncbi:hypothetical protein BKA69DRAFT_453902 [Paraphysoderma sedebokerense]|nr:hypothetical protein BKA69DRAFT_453902 [Paraphysoderma sedebokerense]